ncbi:hypothetical protein D3C79_913290 [compost metagenome]
MTPPLSKALMASCEPLSIRDPVPLPVTVTPLPAGSSKVPCRTDRVTERGLLPASTSPTCNP